MTSPAPVTATIGASSMPAEAKDGDSLKEVSLVIEDSELRDDVAPDIHDEEVVEDEEEEEVKEEVEEEEEEAKVEKPKTTKVKIAAKKKVILKPRRRRNSRELDDEELNRRVNGPQPPLPTRGDFYFFAIELFLVLSISMEWWAWRALPAASSFAALLVVGVATGIVLLVYYWEVNRTAATEFIHLWWHRNETIRRKMKGVIENTAGDTKQVLVLVLVQNVLWATALCGFPAIVFQGEFWTYFNTLPSNLKGLFVSFLIFVFLTLLFTNILLCSIIRSIWGKLKVLEHNDYAVLENQEKIDETVLQTARSTSTRV